MTLTQLAHILAIPEPKQNITFNGISIDTRTLKKGNLFIALPGQNTNGHAFIDQAQQKGAAAALITEADTNTTLPTLCVPDALQALHKLIANWRKQFSLPIVAITGSNGKTTVKNMLYHILIAACQGDKNRVLATQGTLNNHLGVPLTLAQLNSQHQYAVIEMGMNHFGEIDCLTRLTQPQIAVITNAAPAHLAGLGSVAGVARAKGEIFAGLLPNGTAILNKDDPFYDHWLSMLASHPHLCHDINKPNKSINTKIKIAQLTESIVKNNEQTDNEINHSSHSLSFGLHANADITANIHQEDNYFQNFTLYTPIGEENIKLPLLGQHNILNALAASAAAIALNINLTAIKHGLESITPAPGRLELSTIKPGITLINDSYNANPVSLIAAINTLASFSGQRILILGDMQELGAEAESLHYQAGMISKQAGIDRLFTLGRLSEQATIAFGNNGHHFLERKELIHALQPLLASSTTILIKGSRSMMMEKLITDLL